MECIIQKLSSPDSGFQHVLKGLIVLSEDVFNVDQGGLIGLVLFDTYDEIGGFLPLQTSWILPVEYLFYYPLILLPQPCQSNLLSEVVAHFPQGMEEFFLDAFHLLKDLPLGWEVVVEALGNSIQKYLLTFLVLIFWAGWALFIIAE